MKATGWFIGMGVALMACAAQAASVRVENMRCEYLSNPLGIDVVRPRMSWTLAALDPAARGQRQTAYQVLAASTRDLLDREVGDRWDSGEVVSSRSVLVEYDGAPLQSRDAVFWKVRVRDEAGVWTDWSEAASWTMGLLQREDWTAQWVGTDYIFTRREGWPPPDNTIPDPWLRKSFDLPAVPASAATVYVASIGYHELYVNGAKVGDAVLMPHVSDHKHRARYRTYDIAGLLRPGKNTLALWLGAGWSIFPQYARDDRPATPMVIDQAEIELPDQPPVRIATDASWLTHPSPNTLLGVWDFMHFGGEHYDANRHIADWALPTLDESGWTAATVYNPDLILSAEMLEPNRVIQTLPPMAIQPAADGAYRIDLGRNMAGLFEMDLEGPPGSRIEFEFSEHPDETMTHRLRSAYTLDHSGKGTFRNRFNYFSGRWVTVRGLREAPQPDEIRAHLVRPDFRRIGYFACDDDLLNRIHETTLWTFENLSLGGYVVDCPQRERMGYGGDAHATNECGLRHYSLGAFYTKWAQDWRDVQGADGNLPYTAPTYWGGGGPAWSGYCITLPWDMYQAFGDTRILQSGFPTMQRWLEFLDTQAQNDLLVRWGGEWDFLGDWLWPGADGVNGDTPETLFFNNGYWIYNLDRAARIADILQKPEDAARYRARADAVRKAVHKRFFNPEDHSYANGFQGYLAMALYADIPPPDLRSKVWERLETEILDVRDGHIHAGITAGAFLFKTLLEADRQDLIYPMVANESYPGWGDMLRQGATTIWESWDGGSLSRLHSSYLYVGPWFIEGLGGIKPDPNHPGFQHFIIKPGIFGDHPVQWARADYESPYGIIRSHWRIDGDVLELEAWIPPNSTATCYLPSPSPSAITEGNLNLDQAPGVTVGEPQDQWTRITLAPGRYAFRCPL